MNRERPNSIIEQIRATHVLLIQALRDVLDDIETRELGLIRENRHINSVGWGTSQGALDVVRELRVAIDEIETNDRKERA